MTRILVTLALVFLMPSISGSHPGGLDTYGCHNNNKLNVYECHKGALEGKSWPNPGGKEAMLKESLAPVIKRETIGALATWAPVPEATGYRLSFYARDSRDPELTQAEIDHRSYVIETSHTTVFLGCIIPGIDYWFRVQALKDNNVGPWSETVHFRGE